MNRKLTLALAMALAFSSTRLFAIDFGVGLTNITTVDYDGTELGLSQKNEATLWLSTPTGALSSLYVSGLYRFTGDYTFLPAASIDAIVPYLFTAGRVEWDGFMGIGERSSLKWSIGRIPFLDYSGRILIGSFDGAKAEFTYGTILASASVAYTGLTFKEDAKLMIDQDDEAILAAAATADSASWFAPKRIVASLGARFIEVLPLHDFGLDALAQFDVDPAGTVLTHSQYAEPYFEGRIGRALRWRLWGAAEFGEDTAFFYSMAAGGRLRLALPEALGLRLTASAVWAGGDYDGTGLMRAFTPITTGTIATIGSTLFSDALSASLDASVSPLRGLALSANGSAVFKPGEAALADIYLGTEGSLRFALKPVSDFDMAISGGLFVPNSTDAISYSGTVSATIQF